MQDDQEFEFMIRHNGVHFMAPVTGRDMYLKERAFLDDLVAPQYGPRRSSRPVPDPTMDYYELDDAQLEAYSAFRKSVAKQET